jgi:hypothetical protein
MSAPAKIPGQLSVGPMPLGPNWNANVPLPAYGLCQRFNALHVNEGLSALRVDDNEVLVSGVGFRTARLAARIGWWLATFGQMREWWQIESAKNNSLGSSCLLRLHHA